MVKRPSTLGLLACILKLSAWGSHGVLCVLHGGATVVVIPIAPHSTEQVHDSGEHEVMAVQVYELLYLTPLQNDDAARTAIRERVTKTLQDAGATIAAAREFARQRLAYPVKKQQAGEYIVVEFSAAKEAMRGVERELRLLPEILRIMVTRRIEKARPIGAEIEAKERAKETKAATEAPAAAPAATETPAREPQVIEDLDKKLEEILGKDMV